LLLDWGLLDDETPYELHGVVEVVLASRGDSP
jgi:hypothetical protein